MKRLAAQHVADLDKKIAAMQAMRRSLVDLAKHCHGDHHPTAPSSTTSPAG